MTLLQNAYALLIGISYEDGLDTIGDAQDIAALLQDPALCGYLPENVILVTGEQADRNGILSAFDQLIERTDANSSVFLYYSGHGDVLDGIFHFVPHGIVAGMEYDDYTSAWVTAEDIRDKIDRLQTRRLIFFMDCCHATGMAVGGFSPRLGPGQPEEAPQAAFDKLEGLAQKVDNERGISVIASCKEEQESYQLDGDRNSLFTKHLLLALKGEHLEQVRDPYVRILEVAGYLLRVIPETIERVAAECDPPLDIRQEPYVNLEMYDNFVLSYLPEALRKRTTPETAPVVAEAPRPKEVRQVFRESEGANNLILFVHGFSGESTETFGRLPDLLMQDPELDGWDMKPFGYSRFIQPEHGKHVWGGIKDIGRISSYLCTSMKYKFEAYDRVAIVAHGMGGLVAQRAILEMPEAQREKISHLILLACPSNGIPEEDLAAQWQQEYSEMSASGPFITGLRSAWNTAFKEKPPFKLGLIAAADDPFVQPTSCLEAFPGVEGWLLEGNHFSLVKPENTSEPAYRLVRELLTASETLGEFGDARTRNLALGQYDAVARELLPIAEHLDLKGLRQLVFALEGLDRREEAQALLETHPLAAESTDLMGIIGGRYKREFLKRPDRRNGEAAQVYYSIALEQAKEAADQEQVYYHAINLAFLALVMEQDREQMKSYAQQALEAAQDTEDGLWTFATLAEAHLYLGNLFASKSFYEKAAATAGIREKISIYTNAHAAYQALYAPAAGADDYTAYLKTLFLQ